MFFRRFPRTRVFAGLCLAMAIAAHAEPLPVTTASFEATSVDHTLKYNIIFPRGYDASQERYPVLYLLHGLTSHYQLWAMMGVPDYAQSYNFIVVMPDAGNSWYINWAQSEEGQKNLWEDYMIGDLIGHIDATYRTIAKREGRAICGLSMGGYGAITLGLRHPNMFCAIGSHSGALEYARDWRRRIETGDTSIRRYRAASTTPMKIIDTPGFSSAAERYPKGKPFVTVEDCNKYDPFTLVLQVPREDLPHIYLDCGTEDRLIKAARDFKQVLIDNKIPFTYGESAGGHLPAYWTREVAQSMAVQFAVVQRNLTGDAAYSPQPMD